MSKTAKPIELKNKTYIFFDTNSLLNFYELEPKIIKLIEKQIDFRTFKPVLTTLVVGEYKRNRSKILDTTIASLDLKPIKCNLFEDVEGYKELNEEAKKYNNLLKKFKEKLNHKRGNKTLAADLFIKKIIDEALVINHTKVIYNKATEKYNLGYPPGKGVGCNDMLNWLTLIDGVIKFNKKKYQSFFLSLIKRPIQKIYLCTNDNDFLDHKEFLYEEWELETKSKIEFIKLSDLNKNIIPALNSQTERAFKTISETFENIKTRFSSLEGISNQRFPGLGILPILTKNPYQGLAEVFNQTQLNNQIFANLGISSFQSSLKPFEQMQKLGLINSSPKL